MGEVISLGGRKLRPSPDDAQAERLRSRLGAAIRVARGSATQSELGQVLGVGQPAISAWEAGKVRLTVEQVWSIERALGLEHGWLLVASGLCDPEIDPLFVLLEASCLGVKA